MDVTTLDLSNDRAACEESIDAPPIVRFDERRMHVRAYNYWASLLGERALPSIEDLNPAEIQDFGSHSILLDFTSGIDDPSIAFMGSALGAQCDVNSSITRVSQIPPRTLLSRLTDHYLQIIANAAPIGFEAEFTNQCGVEILYRGIMMPFSSDDDTIDFVYGVINWREVASDELSESIAAEMAASFQRANQTAPIDPQWADAAPDDGAQRALAQTAPHTPISPPPLDLSFDMIDDPDEDDVAQSAAPDLDDELVNQLASARAAAAAATASAGRTRAALYRAIGLAHAFALAAQYRPEEYNAILVDAGVVAKAARATSTLVRLIFGADYDKTRIAEFASVLDQALFEELQPGALADHLLTYPGGIKAYVAKARARARGTPLTARPKRSSRARTALASAAAIDAGALSLDGDGLGVAIVRREKDGSIAFVGSIDANDRLIDRVMSKAASPR